MKRASASRSIATPKAPLNRSIPACKAQRRQRRSTSSSANFMLVKPFYNTVPINPIVLEEDFRLREEAYLPFPLEVNDSTTKKAIRCFQVNIKNFIKHIDHIYYYCSRFVNLLQLESILDNNAVLMAAFETNILYHCNCDLCGCCFGLSFNFCHDCWTCVSESAKPKFGIFNKMPQLYCQYHPAP